MRIRIYPYKQGSRSAAVLATALGGRVLKLEGSTFNPRADDVIINWGSTKAERQWAHPVLNNPYNVHVASDKLQAFVRMRVGGNVPLPRHATSTDTVSWEGDTVVRHVLNGHSGRGIEIVKSGRDLPRAPLYVEYIPKKFEFRVHVVGQSIIAVQRKARDPDHPNPNWQVRNHNNGFIFIRNGFETPPAVLEAARAAITALGLDFGAVDIVYNSERRQAYVLEVNTAPGLEGQTIHDYANGFQALIRPQ